MKLRLDNYNFSYKETVFALCTLTGGTLIKRHWGKSKEEASICSKWGHRTIGTIEAIPLLGGLVALIEIVIVKILCKIQECKSPERHLKFNIPTILTPPQILALKIHKTTFESELPEYADSIFQCVMPIDGDYVVTRRKKNEAPPLNGKIVHILPLAGPKQAQCSEGLKVRTLCLELLSNLEDIQTEKQDPATKKPLLGSTQAEFIRIEEMKGVVRYFLEQGALQKKAGFSDFTRLLSLLQEEAKEFRPIFKRYAEWMALQEKLPHKVRHKTSHWDKIRAMVCAGLFVRTLVETAASAQKIGLHPIPALPQRRIIVNLYPTIDAINLLESHYRQAGRWLMHHTRVMTFRELCRSTKASCEQLRDLILGWEDYYLLSIQGKSQAWMADIAYRYLPAEKLPKGVLNLDHHSAGEDLFNHLRKTSFNNFILFDDGAYSAQQFHQYLESLAFCLRQRGHPFIERKTIYFIFGHFPKDIYEESEFKEFEKFNVNIHTLSSLLVRNCRNLMDEENLTPTLKRQIGDLARVERPQLTTEWKRPDFVSTSLFISEGYLGFYSRARNGELMMTNESVTHLHDGVGPLTDVIPPYRNAGSLIFEKIEVI